MSLREYDLKVSNIYSYDVTIAPPARPEMNCTLDEFTYPRTPYLVNGSAVPRIWLTTCDKGNLNTGTCR